jgi:hypothetical protein
VAASVAGAVRHRRATEARDPPIAIWDSGALCHGGLPGRVLHAQAGRSQSGDEIPVFAGPLGALEIAAPGTVAVAGCFGIGPLYGRPPSRPLHRVIALIDAK